MRLNASEIIILCGVCLVILLGIIYLTMDIVESWKNINTLLEKEDDDEQEACD